MTIRNHAAIAPDMGWRLSPAYDLTPTPAVSEDHRDLAMTCGAGGRFASARNLLSECRRFLLQPAEAATVIDAMEATVVAEWLSVARSCGVTEADCALISRSFAYQGFRTVLVHGGD